MPIYLQIAEMLTREHRPPAGLKRATVCRPNGSWRRSMRERSRRLRKALDVLTARGLLERRAGGRATPCWRATPARGAYALFRLERGPRAVALPTGRSARR